MAERGYVLTAQAIREIERVVRECHDRLGNTANRPRVVEPLSQSPETFIAFTEAGIPALTEASGTGSGSIAAGADRPGSGDCPVFQAVTEPSGDLGFQAVPGLRQTVLNVSLSPVPAATWLPVTRDKFGRWLSLYRTVLGVTERIYTADDTWYRPPGLLFIEVFVVGGGGGGGGTVSLAGFSAGGGGGAGSTCYCKIDGSFMIAHGDDSAYIVVGTGGTAVSGGVDGNAGTHSSFTTSSGSIEMYSGEGGGGSKGGPVVGFYNDNSAAPGTPGLPSGAYGGLEWKGSPAGAGFFLATSGAGTDYFVVAGDGGSTPFGAGGRGGFAGKYVAGDGQGYGAGGGGSSMAGAVGAGSSAGGAGAPGVVIIREYLG